MSTKTTIWCKCRAPFWRVGPVITIDERQMGPKRTYGIFNNWCHQLCNAFAATGHKLITNGAETKTYHFISLLHREETKQNRLTLPCCCKEAAFHRKRERYNPDICWLKKKIAATVCQYAVTQAGIFGARSHQLFDGWGDRFISHHFVTIYWTVSRHWLESDFPSCVWKKWVHSWGESVTYLMHQRHKAPTQIPGVAAMLEEQMQQ